MLGLLDLTLDWFRPMGRNPVEQQEAIALEVHRISQAPGQQALRDSRKSPAGRPK